MARSPAGILVLSLLVVPPSDSDAAKSEVHTVQYASLALPAASSWVPLLEKVNVGNQAITVIPVTQLVSAGGFGSATNPASRQVNNAALAATPSGTDLGAIFLQIVGPIVLFAPLFIILIPALPVLLPAAALFYAQSAISWLINSLSPPSAVAPTSAAMVEAKAPSAASLDPAAFVRENAGILGDGLGTSVNVAVRALPSLALLPFSVAFFSLLSPPRIPTVLSLAAEGLDSFWNGVRYPAGFPVSINLGYDDIVPGFYVPTDTIPTGDPNDRHDRAYSEVVDGAILPGTVVAINQVARNLTEAGVPKVVEQTLLSLEKVGIAVQQARVLVRGATVSAVQNVILAATERRDVVGAIQDGFTGVQQAVFGNPDAPDAHVDPYDNTSPTAPSIAQLGAVGSVTTSVRQAVKDVGASLNTSASRQRATTALKSQRRVHARDVVNATIGDVKPKTDPTGSVMNPTRTRPVRDAIAKAGNGITNAVASVRDGLKRALSGGGIGENSDANEDEVQRRKDQERAAPGEVSKNV